MNLTINSRLVAAVAQFRAKQDIRYYLCGVYVEPIPTGGALIVATNGHALGLWRDKTATVERAAILRTDPELVAACANKDAKILQIIDDRLTVVDKKGFELFVQPKREKWELEGTYPNWRRVIPETGEELKLFDALNPNLVSTVEQALKIGTNGARFSGITFNQPAANGAILVTSNSQAAQDFLAVIMPLRESVSTKPKWIEELKAATTNAPLPGQQPSDAKPDAEVAA